MKSPNTPPTRQTPPGLDRQSCRRVRRSPSGPAVLLVTALLCSGGTAAATPNVTVGSITVAVGYSTNFAVILSGTGVAGMQGDIAFDSTNAPIAVGPNGTPDCTSACNKAGQFVFLPIGCGGRSCTKVRAFLGADLSPSPSVIPTGATLFTCRISIPPAAALGTYSLVASNLAASNTLGNKLTIAGHDGTVTVHAPPPPPPPISCCGRCGMGFELALILPLLWLLRRAVSRQPTGRRIRVVLVAVFLWILPFASAAQGTTSCVGDCNGDGMVTIDEIITAVHMIFGAPLSACPQADANHDNQVRVDEVIKMVNVALNGCTPVAQPGTHALFHNPDDPNIAVYKTLQGETILYRGDKDANGVPTALRSATLTSSSGALKATIDYANGAGQPTHVQMADGTAMDMDWSVASVVRVQVHLPGGSSFDYAVPFAGNTGAAAATGTASGGAASTTSHAAHAVVTRCGRPVTNAWVEMTVTPTEPHYFSDGTKWINYTCNGCMGPGGGGDPGLYTAWFPVNPAPSSSQYLADMCPAANATVDGALYAGKAVAGMGATTFCGAVLEEAGPALYDKCAAAVDFLGELFAKAREMVPEGHDVFNCEYLQQLIDEARFEQKTVQLRVGVWGSSEVVSLAPVTVNSLAEIPDFNVTLPNAIIGGQIVAAAGTDANNYLGAGDAGTAVTCAPANTSISIKWHHAVLLPDNIRTCTVSGNGNCDSYFGPVVNCCELCPGGCSAAICPGDYFEQTFPGGAFYLDSSRLFWALGADVFPGCFQ